jgi:TPR repeat protein
MIGKSLLIAALLTGASFAAPARAESGGPERGGGDEVGTLNPPSELSVEYWAERSKEARFDPGMCMYGYPLAKMSWHDAARRIFERCAEHNNVYAMPWAAWTEENGYDRPSDPAKAADWDKRLADTGSSIGQLNYGLDLLRGHGVAQDRALGKALVDQSAAAGDKTARELAQHDYDPESVTPTADLAHYRKPQF